MFRVVQALVPAAVAAALVVTAVPAGAQQLDTVLRWNRAMLTAVATPGANPATVFVTRPLAMASVAMFDAANAFERRYQGYDFVDAAPAGASRDAAVAQAAHDVLVALLPSQTAALDALLATSLAGLDDAAARDGAAVGAAAAQAVLADRTGDGWERPFPPLVLPGGPGYWIPTPPANANAAYTNYPQVRGFVVPDGRQFLPEAPPSLASARYATDLNETKAFGSAESTVRTAEQTQAARLWASVGTSTHFWIVWNQVTGTTALSQGLSGLEAARAFALVNMTHHDALMTSFTGKFVYGLWRPVTAIREAASDGNGDTDPDPEWLPLLPTPPYPSAPGNMACIGASLSRVLDRLFGPGDVGFSVTWTGTTGPTTTRTYNNFGELSEQEAYSRIWGGIHFLSETLSSAGQCARIGDYAVDNVLRKQ